MERIQNVMMSVWNVVGPFCRVLKVLIGPFQVLNLFLALLLSSFGAESLQNESGAASDEPEATNKIAEAFNRFSRYNFNFSMFEYFYIVVPLRVNRNLSLALSKWRRTEN